MIRKSPVNRKHNLTHSSCPKGNPADGDALCNSDSEGRGRY